MFQTQSQQHKLPVIFLIIIFGVIMLRSAWITDDAYITFRTIDNFVNGYGLTWNISERVQTYTHPLWMLLVLSSYFFTREIYFTSLFVSILISLITITILAFKIAQNSALAIFSVTILFLSKAFMDYSTSGLENPLTHLLLVLFLWLYYQFQVPKPLHLFLLSLIAGLGTLNRMDNIILHLPILGYFFLKLPTWKNFIIGLTGFFPLIIWELFSIVYYGFPFPNTAYAKLNTGVARYELVEQGIYYLLNSFFLDPLTLSVVFFGLITPFITQHKPSYPIVISVFLYIVYIVNIGGDFMSGRFLTAPLLVAVSLISRQSYFLVNRNLILVLLIITLVGLTNPYNPIWNYVIHIPINDQLSIIDNKGIADERRVYEDYNLFELNRNKLIPQHGHASSGIQAQLNEIPVVIAGTVGYFGYYAGPKVHIIDFLALGDPLLARLPTTYPRWRPGHFVRRIPSGYAETILTRQNQLNDLGLVAYYDKLTLVTRGNLFTKQRFVEIFKLNFGLYNDLLNSYAPIVQLTPDNPYQFTWQHISNLTNYAGLHIDLTQPVSSKYLEVHLSATQVLIEEIQNLDSNIKDYRDIQYQIKDNHRNYEIYYLNQNTLVTSQHLSLPLFVPDNGAIAYIENPPIVRWYGFDTIKIFPVQSDSFDKTIYSIDTVNLLETMQIP